jgi:hypothetical protein
VERKAGVFEAGDIREWRGHDVVDSEGHKIGELEAIYVDTSTDLPAFATVTVGMPTRYRLVFVPLAQATVGPGYLKVAHDRKHVNDSPLDQHRRRAAFGRRRGHLQALRPDISGRHQR